MYSSELIIKGWLEAPMYNDSVYHNFVLTKTWIANLLKDIPYDTTKWPTTNDIDQYGLLADGYYGTDTWLEWRKRNCDKHNKINLYYIGYIEDRTNKKHYKAIISSANAKLKLEPWTNIKKEDHKREWQLILLESQRIGEKLKHIHTEYISIHTLQSLNKTMKRISECITWKLVPKP